MRKIRICADPFPPYQYIGEDGNAAGQDYEIVYNALTAAGYEVEITIAPWSEVIEAFEKQECDALFQVQDTPERVATYRFSMKLRDAVTDVVRLRNSELEISSYEELGTCRIGLISGFANGDEIDNLPESCKMYYNGTQEIIDALYCGEIDAGVCDRGVREYLTGCDDRIVPVEKLTYRRPLYVMFHSEALRDEFNSSLQRISENMEDKK